MQAIHSLVAPGLPLSGPAALQPAVAAVSINSERVRKLTDEARRGWSHSSLPRPRDVVSSRARADKALSAALAKLEVVKEELDAMESNLHIPKDWLVTPERDILDFAQALEEAQRISARAEATILTVTFNDDYVKIFKNDLLARIRTEHTNFPRFELVLNAVASTHGLDLERLKTEEKARLAEEEKADLAAREHAVGTYSEYRRYGQDSDPLIRSFSAERYYLAS